MWVFKSMRISVSGWTSLRKLVVLTRMWRSADLRSVRGHGSALHERSECVWSESLRGRYVACGDQPDHLLHRQCQDHQATSQLRLLQHRQRHLDPRARVRPRPLQQPHHQADLPSRPRSNLPQPAGNRLRLGNALFRWIFTFHSSRGRRHRVR